MPIRGGLQPYNKVFNASDHTLGHGATELDDKGNVLKHGNDHRFDKLEEAKRAEEVKRIKEKDEEIQRLKKLLAQKQPPSGNAKT